MQSVARAPSPALHEESVSPVVKEKSTSRQTIDVAEAANPAEALICGNEGIRKDLGALSGSSWLPQRPASSRVSYRRFPGESEKEVRKSSAGGEDEGSFAC